MVASGGAASVRGRRLPAAAAPGWRLLPLPLGSARAQRQRFPSFLAVLPSIKQKSTEVQLLASLRTLCVLCAPPAAQPPARLVVLQVGRGCGAYNGPRSPPWEVPFEHQAGGVEPQQY